MALEGDPDVTNTDQEPAVTDSAFMLGDVEVRPYELKLVVEGEVRRVEPLVMDLLVYGSDRVGQLLSRDKILGDVWGDIHRVPETLQRVVSQLRKALGDQPSEPLYIETVSSRGYRFLVEPVPMGNDEPGSGEEDIRLTEKSIRISPLHVIFAVAALAVLAWLAMGDFGGEEAYAPQAEGGSETNAESNAPVPKPED